MDPLEVEFFISEAMKDFASFALLFSVLLLCARPLCDFQLAMATFLKQQAVERGGGTGGSAAWHVVVGRNFASNLTHETDHYLYFYIGQTGFLVWKTP
ncbi:dynein light chain type 1 [Toxoplasma gondii TgCatPRC2]|uniref:Dynein light chain type 1 n=1 Tax=Toxoplasma gondii TgCatPRC2 TaxID=1130821 RepID=A0A151H9N1_TOXGO|nr:dynein light chain type 1 [Toxoplasma gondii TgCatPRC2]